MKKLLHFSALVVFVLLYIFAVSVENQAVVSTAYFNNHEDNTADHFSDQGARLFYHTNQNAEINYSSTRVQISDSRKFSRIYTSIVQVTGNILERKFIQFTFAERSFPLLFSKSDIAYPFHHFL